MSFGSTCLKQAYSLKQCGISFVCLTFQEKKRLYEAFFPDLTRDAKSPADMHTLFDLLTREILVRNAQIVQIAAVFFARVEALICSLSKKKCEPKAQLLKNSQLLRNNASTETLSFYFSLLR